MEQGDFMVMVIDKRRAESMGEYGPFRDAWTARRWAEQHWSNPKSAAFGHVARISDYDPKTIRLARL
jgi:hypothetical protein